MTLKAGLDERPGMVKSGFGLVADPDFDEDEFKEQMKQAKQRVREARRQLELAEEFAASTENA